MERVLQQPEFFGKFMGRTSSFFTGSLGWKNKAICGVRQSAY